MLLGSHPFGMRLWIICEKKIILLICEYIIFLFSVLLVVSFFSHYVIMHFVFREMELLQMPKNTDFVPMVQWPLFLLASKVIKFFEFSVHIFFPYIMEFHHWSHILFIVTFRYSLLKIWQLRVTHKKNCGTGFHEMITWNMQLLSVFTPSRWFWPRFLTKMARRGKCIDT